MPTVARNHPSVWQEPWIQMDNTVQLTANLMRSPVLIQLILEVAKRQHFVELKELI